MQGFFGFFADTFGYVLNAIYNIDFIKNYGLAIIIFTILVKVVLLPVTFKQQKTMKKTAELQGEVKKIQDKYKTDKEKASQEIAALYKRENMSPCSGCFSSIIQIILLLSVFYLVSQPLTHMRRVDRQYPSVDPQIENVNIVEYYKNQLKEEETNQKTMYAEINIIRQKGQQDERVYINMNFLGLDLSEVPSGDLSNIKVYIIPALYVITSIISIQISTKTQQKKEEADKVAEDNKKEEEDIDLSTQMNKNMKFVTPLLSVMIAMVAPLGLALYWLVNNILTIAERVVIDKYLKKSEEEK